MKKLLIVLILTTLAGCNSFNSYKTEIDVREIINASGVDYVPAKTIVTLPPEPKPTPLIIYKTVTEPTKVVKIDKMNICPSIKLPTFLDVPEIGEIKSQADLIKHIKDLRLYIRNERIKREKTLRDFYAACDSH